MLLQAITEMTRRLRGGRDTHGLILANGGVLTYQHVICLSSEPRKDKFPYPQERPLPEQTNAPHPALEDIAEGAATIEVRGVRVTKPLLDNKSLSPREFLLTTADIHCRLRPRRSAAARSCCGNPGRKWSPFPLQSRRRSHIIAASELG